MRPRKIAWLLAALLCHAVFSGCIYAQEEIDPCALLSAADEWAAENIDDSVWDALGIDTERTRQFVTALQKQLQGEYVLDLAALREPARQFLPVLEQFEETQPYAIWLRSHMDYFDVSRTLSNQAPATTNKTARPQPPTAAAQRNVWVKVVEERPVPKTARDILPRLKQIFREERAPEELVWVAEVESSFNARARSPVGAAGLFQLMPITARSYDLSVGLIRDERLNGEKNARVAAKYLRKLHLRFRDWRLALAAYNAGETRVAELLRKHRATSFDSIASRLPAETQMFVPKVEAVIRKREGRALETIRLPN